MKKKNKPKPRKGSGKGGNLAPDDGKPTDQERRIEMLANMEMVRDAINHNTNIYCEIQNIYIDLGANWMERTVVSISPREYQILNPRQVKEAVAGIMQMAELQSVIDEINKRGW